METFLIPINIILAVLLIIVVLLQKSEGGALGIGNSQESFISSRTAGNFLTKITSILATLFILTSLILTIISNKNVPTTSILDTVEEKNEQSLPEIPKSRCLGFGWDAHGNMNISGMFQNLEALCAKATRA